MYLIWPWRISQLYVSQKTITCIYHMKRKEKRLPGNIIMKSVSERKIMYLCLCSSLISNVSLIISWKMKKKNDRLGFLFWVDVCHLTHLRSSEHTLWFVTVCLLLPLFTFGWFVYYPTTLPYPHFGGRWRRQEAPLPAPTCLAQASLFLSFSPSPPSIFLLSSLCLSSLTHLLLLISSTLLSPYMCSLSQQHNTPPSLSLTLLSPFLPYLPAFSLPYASIFPFMPACLLPFSPCIYMSAACHHTTPPYSTSF